MKSIEWNSFDGMIFQQFCNSVIMLEVSKTAHVYNAPGPDKGVDQYFTGDYGGQKGKWRFQNKFHNSGKKPQDISALKRDIINDIRDNYNGEDFIVYLTNVNLNKSKEQEFLTAAEKELNKKEGEHSKIFIWHEPKLLTVLESNPVLYNWYWEKENILLLDHQSYFRPQLDLTSDLRYQLMNTFFGRNEELAKLKEFVSDPKHSTMAIVANGGYGKTRLCIEFFSSLVFKDDEWLPVVLSHTGFTPSSFNVLLRTPKRLLILIDNANEIPEIVNDVKQLVDDSKGKHKLLITTRKSLFSTVISKIPAYRNNIQVLELTRLSYDETKEMVINLLPYLRQQDVITLSNLSKGVPNVILELARIVEQGKQPSQISAENFFTEGVRTIIREIAADIHRLTSLPVEKTFDLLRLIAIISPVPRNKESMTFIASLLEIRFDQVERLLNSLSDSGIMGTGGIIVIRPDPYSDAILADTIQNNKTFVEHIRVQPGMEKYFENILKNLAEAELPGDEIKLFIKDLLIGYVNQIEDKSIDYRKLKAIFEFAGSIYFSHPHIAIRSIRSFIKIYSDPGWSLKTDAAEIKEIVNRTIAQLYAQTSYAKDNLHLLHTLLVDYVRVTGDHKIVGAAYGYHEWDFEDNYYRPRKCCERQAYLKTIITKDLECSDNRLLLGIALEGAKVLLKLDYHLQTYYEEVTMQMTVGIGYVRTCEHTKEIRGNILKSLMTFFRRFNGDPILRAAAFAILKDYFFHSSFNYSTRYCYEIDEEIILVFAFLKEMLTKELLSTKEKAIILEKAQLFQTAGIRDPFTTIVSEIITLSSQAKTLYDELEMNILNRDYFDVRNNLEGRIKHIIESYNDFQQFRSDLVKAYRDHHANTENFGPILNTISVNYPEDAKKFFQYLLDEHADLAPHFVDLLSAVSEDADYLYNIIEKLWVEKNKCGKAVLWLLTSGRKGDRKHYRAADLHYFENVIEEGPLSLFKLPFYYLLDYAYLDKERTFKLLDKVMEYSTGNFYNIIINILFDTNSRSSDDFAHQIKDLAYKHIGKIVIDEAYYGDIVLSFIEANFGFQSLLDFVYLKVQNSLQGEHYKFITLHDHIYIPKNNRVQEGNQRFLLFLNWFMTKEQQTEDEMMVGEYIIKMFRPTDELSNELGTEILKIAAQFKGDYTRLYKLAKAIRLFPPKTTALIITLARVAELILHAASNVDESNVHNIFGPEFYYHTGGVKTKSGRGVPFPEDVKKRDLFRKVLQENNFDPAIEQYFKQCEARAQQDIDDEVKSDSEKMRW